MSKMISNYQRTTKPHYYYNSTYLLFPQTSVSESSIADLFDNLMIVSKSRQKLLHVEKPQYLKSCSSTL